MDNLARRDSGAPAEVPAPFGLSNRHISPHFTLSYAHGGHCVAVASKYPWAPQKRPWRRAEIDGFSERSRSRLIRTLAEVDQSQQSYPPLFVTLTYPKAWPELPTDWKRHLDIFGKRLLRDFPAASAVWRLELQERGAPHFHNIVFGPRFISYKTVAQDWYEIVDSGLKDHLDAGTEVRACDGWSDAKNYVAKYVAKQCKGEYDWKIGRHWGIIGRKNLPKSIKQVEIPDWAFRTIRDELFTIKPAPENSTVPSSEYIGWWADAPPAVARQWLSWGRPVREGE